MKKNIIYIVPVTILLALIILYAVQVSIRSTTTNPPLEPVTTNTEENGLLEEEFTGATGTDSGVVTELPNETATLVATTTCTATECTARLSSGYMFNYPIEYVYLGFREHNQRHLFSSTRETSNPNKTNAITVEVLDRQYAPNDLVFAPSAGDTLPTVVTIGDRTWSYAIGGELGCVGAVYHTDMETKTLRIGFRSCRYNPETRKMEGAHLYEDKAFVEQVLGSLRKQ